ncbi:MAG: hypothetical protein B1H04_02695, partial [Planctomycetales bacterium 4484_123]
MAVEFRCEKCGKLLSVDAQPDSKIKCPYCKAKLVVPAGVASLPRPQVPAGAPGQGGPGQPQPPEQAEEPSEDEAAVMGAMARVMPWLISLFFHVGLLVILAFITIVVFSEASAEYNATSDLLSDNPGGQLNPGQMNPEMQAHSRQRINRRRWSKRDSQIPMASVGQTKSRIQVFGIAGGSAGGQSADFGLTTGGSGAGPKSRFFGTGGSAYHIVYVVDRSGSMIETFDEVREEMKRSILRLSPAQTFHVIFFSSGTPKENPPRRLVHAVPQNKRQALRQREGPSPHPRAQPAAGGAHQHHPAPLRRARGDEGPQGHCRRERRQVQVRRAQRMRGTTPVLPGRLLAAVMLLAVPAALQADAIKLKNGLTYTPAVVVKAEDGYIHFRLMSGRVVAKPLSSVARIEIKGLGEFNRAEELAE